MNTLKKYNWLFLIAMVCMTFTACSDFLNEAPSDAFDDETALVDIEDFEKTLLNTHVRLRSEAYYGGEHLLLPDVMGDNLILCSDGRGTYQDMWRWQFNASTTPSLWAICYAGIKDANHVIQRLTPTNKFDGTDDEERGNNVLAAAYAMRAFFHFDLVRTYAKTYVLATGADLGVPYKETTEVDKPARNTVHDVYAKIISDLENAIALMSDDYNSLTVPQNNAYINKKAVYGILARVYITMAGKGVNTTYLEKARDYAKLAVAGDGTDVALRTNFAAIWTGSNTVAEVLWRLPVTSSDGELIGNFYGQDAGPDGYKNEYVVTQDWYNLWPNSDIRGISWASPDAFQGRQYIGVKKYRDQTDVATKNKVDGIIMRTSEMYLTIAEAEYFLGNEANALTNLNYVRSQRYSNFTSPGETGGNLLNAILLERRLELAFEGHRWYDLKRWAEGMTRDNKGDRADGTGTPSPFTTKSGNDPYWAMPIPLSEILANPNMEQNQY